MSDPVSLPQAGVWYAEGLRFSCTQCGNCCSGAPGYVWVSREEQEKIAAVLGLSLAEFSRKHLRRVGVRYSLLERPGGDCEFLAREGKKTRCLIHAVRPVQCRTWPFWESNVASEVDWAAAAEGCPGIGQGPVHSAQVIQSALRDNGRLPL